MMDGSGVDTGWTQADAIQLCREIEDLCPAFGCHVALTGGTLYKDGPRKDCDILFYRIRQVDAIDTEGLFKALATIGVEKVSGFGWCHKAIHQGRKIDCFFPEAFDGDYEDHKTPAVVHDPNGFLDGECDF